jgi:2-dehydro-3-deoxy-D-arabinonate dehydratase
VPLCYFLREGSAEPRFGLIAGERVVDVEASGGPATLAAALQLPLAEFRSILRSLSEQASQSSPLDETVLAAPIDQQEVWAAGVTYMRSRDARMEESTQKSVYDLVYDADRPELFLKATPNRVSGPGDPIAIRSDSTWDVPEPELAILLNADGDLVGYTIGNDVSSRSIEGENPLYLPQAKVYAMCAAIGPAVVTIDELADVSDLDIELSIRRGGETIFQDTTSTSRIHRSLRDLISYLRRDNQFPFGVYLMTGTGIVPPAEFTLQDGDAVTIRIEALGALSNPVIRLSS